MPSTQVRISDLPAVSGDDADYDILFEVTDDGVSRKLTGKQLFGANFAAGSSAPSDTRPGMFWLDTSENDPILRVRNAADNGWVQVSRVVATLSDIVAGEDNERVVTPARLADAFDGRQITEGQATDPGNTVFRLVSGERLAQAFDAREQQFGVGQTWHDMTDERDVDTVYQNTTGRPIMISVVSARNQDVAAFFEVSEDGSTNWLSVFRTTGGGQNSASTVVPDGWYYRTDGDLFRDAAKVWMELR